MKHLQLYGKPAIAFAALVLALLGVLCVPSVRAWLGIATQRSDLWFRTHFEGGPPVRRDLLRRVNQIQWVSLGKRTDAYQGFFEEHGFYYNLLLLRADVLLTLGRPEDALTDVNHALALYDSLDGWGDRLYFFPMEDSDSPMERSWLVSIRAPIHEELGNWEQSIADYRSLGWRYFAHVDLGRVEARRGNWDRALREFEMHLESRRGPAAVGEVEEALIQIGRPGGARHLFK